MRRLALTAALLALAACGTQAIVNPSSPSATAPAAPTVAAFAHPPLSGAAVIEHVRVLASDEFEGRKPGTRGEQLTLDYLERAFTAAGLQGGVTRADGSRSFRQEVPLVSSTVTGNPVLTISGGRGAASNYTFATQFVAWSKRVEPRVSIENAPLVFVGYGVVAPERNWNDYAGVDMRGKIAVILVNDPDFETGRDGGFGGRAMTYYGRWTYKFEEAARQGAAGALIIHETAPASYPWAVVASSASTARLDTVREDNGASRAAVEGWVTLEVGQALFQRAGLNFAQQKARAQRAGFRPVTMGRLRGSVALDLQTQRHTSYNIVAVLPGASAPDEAVIYTAHWDHLGRCTPVNGDDICNGALDNASGTGGMIEIARRFAAEPRPARSVAFIAVTAEEQGLLGSQYYADHPTFRPQRMVANINMDGLSMAGRSRDMNVVGFGKSQMDDLVTAAAQAQGRRITPDPFPERGGFFRSDQFHFARIGVPVLFAGGGIDLVEGGEARGRQLSDDYLANRYHKPQDEMSSTWNTEGAEQDLQVYYNIGRQLATSSNWPQWRADAEFRRQQ